LKLKVYALKNCDTCKKSIAWLSAQAISFDVQDVRSDGLSAIDVEAIVNSLGWEQAVNRRSTTWRNLDEAEKTCLDNAKAAQLILAHPTLMKRPVFRAGTTIVCGFNTGTQSKILELIRD
jgi:arsenate reductase